MKVRKLLSGFLAAIITVLVVVSLADGGDPNGDTVTAEELKEKGITLQFPKPVKTAKINNVEADGCCYLDGWTINISEDGMTGTIYAGETSHHTGFVLECGTEKFSGDASWETELLVGCSFSDFAGNQGEGDGYLAYFHARAGQAFQVNGHLETGDPNEDPYVETVFDRFITRCTATVTISGGKPFSIPVEQVDKRTVRPLIPALPPDTPDTKFLLELNLTDEDGNHGYCATTITTPNLD